METPYHRPVLLHQTVEGLAVVENGIYVDVTFGGGGHSMEILKRLGPEGRLFAFDQDEAALANKPDDSRFELISANFRYIRQYLKFYGILKVDGILGDFGVSSHQFDQAERGFSTRFNANLDMRMNQKESLSAKEMVNTYSEARIREVLSRYGELKRSPAIARAITASRAEKPIETTEELNAILRPFLQRGKEHKGLAQAYQAIRIEVNQELIALQELLMQSVELLRYGGRLSLISYHSLEDRLVKRFIRSGNFEGVVEKDFYGNPLAPFKAIGKPVTPSAEEVSANPRARSARLRVAERIEVNTKNQ
ncbi:16S rRNA (cytosine(1402)-N(4))-methyltransferase RsmH [Robiginitalea aurantiaca]|uniref:Ribosomal RNA small subunit methyltransferase H n=1 Tax=Robiginitalea aurantiaca TaxID=3056915 RepID=A0ABT7WI14_9FLAO|nr:16S rRNA (cytosine(1402)-N(4))-methyltransferase RsmH [Robiginitalea aurantiaca]MDM9632546.1 16S rRNA (cytosine(1402)-N(4))-methyltransferase RsmH [Robiginitalea aurantiaca]